MLLVSPANAQTTRTEMMEGCYNTFMEQLRLSRTWRDEKGSPQEDAHRAMLAAFRTQYDHCLSRASR
jgi:hypothetical protein